MTLPEQHIDIAKRWMAAFNDHNLEEILSLYHDNAQHYSPKLKQLKPATNGFIDGKQALRDWWRSSFEAVPSLNYSLTTLTADEKRVFMEYIRRVDSEPDSMIAEVLQIKNGLIVSSRVYHA